MKQMRWLLYNLALFILLYSCIDDTGNYDYKTLGNVSFGEISDDVSCIVGEKYNVQGNIITDIPDENLEYLWYLNIYDGGEGYFADTLWREKDLTCLVKLSPGKYEMHYEVYDKNNNVRYDKIIKLNVVTKFTSGWGILTNNNGKASFDFVTEANGLNYYSDVLNNITGEIPTGTPLRLDFANERRFSVVNILTSEGGIVLEGSSMAKKWNILDDFRSLDYLELPFTGGYLNSQAYRGVNTQILIADGKIYPITSADEPGEGFWEAPVPGDYSVDNHFTCVFGNLILFDKSNKRYVYLSNGDVSKLKTMSAANENPAFDPENVNKDCMWMDVAAVSPGVMDEYSFAILKDDSGKYFLHMFNWFFDGFNAEVEYEFSDGTIDDNSVFAVNQIYPYVYISKGNNIHRFNTQSKSLQLNWKSFESNITRLQVAKEGEEMAIALQNGSNSKFVLINPIDDTEIASFDVEGEIIDMNYKIN